MTAKRVQYTIDGIPLERWGVYVEASRGVLDLPKPKAPLSKDWADEHGTFIDLKGAPRYEDRQIELDCFLKADSPEAFVERCVAFTEALDKGGLRRLSIHPFADESHPPLLYDVYLSEGIQYDKRWRGGVMYGRFTLRLTEPMPIKRVYSVQATKGGRIAFTLTSPSPISFSWGDGSHSHDVIGKALKVEHTYREAGRMFILLSGNLDQIESLQTKATLHKTI